MARREETKEKLLNEGRNLFWNRGYSNVSLRDIAGAAGVDVALISRYFGSKLGLFTATIDLIDDIDPAQITSPADLVEAIVQIYICTPRDTGAPSALGLILTNAGDPEAGAVLRAAYMRKWQGPMDQIIGDPHRAALFSAAMLGMAVAEKTLHLPGIAAHHSPAFEAQLRTLLMAALDHSG